ncbi:hypothetical protein H2203_008638 [Taxawa tesnikishii (nom. ined.)]|nr:hypothetical protein H2203_008638 [Dothideales sp. JES 119]
MRKKFHGLKRPKIRQDWSKWNLYNLSRMILPPAANKTFFQQKWLAKSNTRAYHGEQIREGQWTRMFDRRLPAVVPMDHRVLASTDGSDQSAGRGSGLDQDPSKEQTKRRNAMAKTPYMHMTYHPTERRLDTAIWRALFASSTRQARQFVVHGFVKVNGKKMIYPGYLLNPGDMFSVDPERVLYATGARKDKKGSPETSQGQTGNEEIDQIVDDDAEDLLEGEEEEGASAVESGETSAEEKAETTEETALEDPRKALKLLLSRAKDITSDPKQALSGKRKQELRAFSQTAKKTLSQVRGTKFDQSQPLEETIESLEETLNSILAKVPSSSSAPAETSTSTQAASEPSQPAKSSNPQMQNGKEDAYNARRDAELLRAAISRAQENPIDVRRPYATPWQPREFMSAFAFIPRYLEVNQNICSAVYLRHPVARPGLAEVPTPFHGETMALAFNWYLRRR